MNAAWYRSRALIAGAALILATNAVALLGAAYNRAGEPESRLALTERELPLAYRGRWDGEDSGIALALRWRVLGREREVGSKPPYLYSSAPAWLDRTKLGALGFDVSQPVDTKDGRRYYDRTLSREVLLVLELDGPAYREALDRARRDAQAEAERLRASPNVDELKRRAAGARAALEREERAESRLFVVDAGLDAEALRERYPDRGRYAIVRGTVRPVLAGRANGAYLTGYVGGPSIGTIHVPLAHRRLFESLEETRARAWTAPPRYAVTVAFGRRLEPWLGAASRLPAAGR